MSATKSEKHNISDRQNMFFEFHLTDHCNLNCKRCAHFAPVAKPRYASMDEVIEAMKIIQLVLPGHVNILGGEPLLHPDIDEILEYMGSNMPEGIRATLVTNGILLDQMSDAFWDIVKRGKINVRITVYPAKIDYQKIVDLTKAKGVRLLGLQTPALRFYAVELSEDGRNDPEYAYASCRARCVQIRDGRLYPCPYSAYIEHINESYGTKFSHVEGEDYLVIEKITGASDVEKWLKKAKPFCTYCNYGRGSLVRWEHSVEHDMEEWVELF